MKKRPGSTHYKTKKTILEFFSRWRSWCFSENRFSQNRLTFRWDDLDLYRMRKQQQQQKCQLQQQQQQHQRHQHQHQRHQHHQQQKQNNLWLSKYFLWIVVVVVKCSSSWLCWSKTRKRKKALKWIGLREPSVAFENETQGKKWRFNCFNCLHFKRAQF